MELADTNPAENDPEQWLAAYGDKLYCFALRHVSRQEVAEDLVQETLLAAWRGRERFDGRSTRETWLISILRHKIIDHLRRPRRESQPLQTENDGGEASFDSEGYWKVRPGTWSATEQAVQNREFWEVLTGCVGELPEHLATAFKLREISTEKTSEICQSLGITQENLSVRLHRARVLLRGCLEKRWFND